ncbi:MAG: heavy metal translocating P-type ATPase, partial [Synergistaceae bacterium]|nr:heavy metal translocating P-type ATPase [Synergistaceae bacterium]
MANSHVLRLSLGGLNCAHCSARIEKSVSELPGVSSASIDMVSGGMKISLDGENRTPEIITGVRQIVDAIEPGVSVHEERPAEGRSNLPKGDMARLAAGAALWLGAIFLPLGETTRFFLYVAAYLTAGIKVIRNVFRNLRGGSVFDEFFLMTIATAGAFAIGDFSEAVAVMLFYESGELVQDLAVERSRRSILATMDVRPDRANLIAEGDIRIVRADEVTPGQTILVKPGEQVPLDGTVLEGTSSLNTASLTGESVPADAGPGSEVLAGSVNLGGALSVRVTRPYGETTLSKGLKLIEEARESKAPTERFITSFARWYTPAVVVLAALIATLPPLAGLGDFRTW